MVAEVGELENGTESDDAIDQLIAQIDELKLDLNDHPNNHEKSDTQSVDSDSVIDEIIASIDESEFVVDALDLEKVDLKNEDNESKILEAHVEISNINEEESEDEIDLIIAQIDESEFYTEEFNIHSDESHCQSKESGSDIDNVINQINELKIGHNDSIDDNSESGIDEAIAQVNESEFLDTKADHIENLTHKFRDIFNKSGTCFIYFLLDPFKLRDPNATNQDEAFKNAIFYVGKGTTSGERFKYHMKEARKYKRNLKTNQQTKKVINTSKLDRIISIMDKGRKVVNCEIFPDLSEEEALARELCCIKACKKRETLVEQQDSHLECIFFIFFNHSHRLEFF